MSETHDLKREVLRVRIWTNQNQTMKTSSTQEVSLFLLKHQVCLKLVCLDLTKWKHFLIDLVSHFENAFFSPFQLPDHTKKTEISL